MRPREVPSASQRAAGLVPLGARRAAARKQPGPPSHSHNLLLAVSGTAWSAWGWMDKMEGCALAHTLVLRVLASALSR